jgi:hypothetical protein
MMKTINKILVFTAFLLIFFSCTEDNITRAGDSMFDYDIPNVPVTSDYVVGAKYSRFVRNRRVVEEPSIGVYPADRGDPVVYEQHVNQAQTAGIDFFIFEMRSSNNQGQYNQDITFIDGLLSAPNANDVNFAIRYNFDNMGLNNNNRIEARGLVDKFIDDFKLMIPYFEKPNYTKVDGKNLVYVFNAHNLFSDDNVALYQQMRTELSALGFELFIIGEQVEWTPPLRYDFRFVNAVDAVAHKSYALINVNQFDQKEQFHKVIDIAFEYHKETFASVNLEYIPTVSPSQNFKLQNPNHPSFVIEKDAAWFRDFCNVARRVSGNSKIILLDSFNDWNFGTQIESADTYGEDYLQILREEFKVN